MRKYAGFLVFFVLLILIIPTLALMEKQPGSPKEGSSSSGQAVSISQEDFETNNFYLVKNHETGEVMTMTPADYIKGVVAAEMPISYHTEALKAQAVAAHTYALRQIDAQLSSPTSGMDGAYLSTDPATFQAWISVDQMKQNWGENFTVNYQKLSDAVDAVIGEALTYQDKPIIAAFHSISSGKTESAQNVWGQEVSYLTPVDSEGDELSPNYETQTVLKTDEVRHALEGKYPSIKLDDDPSKWFAVKEKSESGTITQLTAGDVTMTGRELRELFSLKSANFTIDCAGGIFTFHCLGYGHGVGMSQYGADYLARQGKNYKEILLHYYSGVTLSEIPEKK